MRFYKNEGETPLEALNRLRKENPQYEDSTLSYAGRLDPMAEGELLVLVDDENKEREKYLNFDKAYEVDILFGIKTDTGDILGVIRKIEGFHPLNILGVKPLNFSSFIGDITLPYPTYSSRTVNGKPLFQIARENKIDEIEIPIKTSKIFSIKLLEEYSLNSEEILKQIKSRIKKVNGDFRQEEIIQTWEKNLKGKNEEFQIYKIEVKCSSGTYMRSLAEAIAQSLGTCGMAWKIKRTQILAKKA